MTDREKVINELVSYIENALSVDSDYVDCIPTYLLQYAVVLLKEQDAKIEHLKRPDCEHAEHDGIGCLGYCGCTQDDEPIESYKRCEKYTGNVYEAVKWE